MMQKLTGLSPLFLSRSLHPAPQLRPRLRPKLKSYLAAAGLSAAIWAMASGSASAQAVYGSIAGTVFDSSTATASESDLFCGFFNDGNWEVSCKIINDDDCLAAPVGAFPSQHDAA